MATKKAARKTHAKSQVSKPKSKQVATSKAPKTVSKAAKITQPKQASQKNRSLSKTKSKQEEKRTTKTKSPPSRKTSKSSQDFLKGEFSPKLSVIPLTPTGKRLKTASGKQVIYGIQEKTSKGKVTTRKLDMAPQTFRQADLQALSELVKKSATAQESKKPKLAFFQVKVPDEYERTKTGRVKKMRVKAGPLKGKLAPVFKTEMRFEAPKDDNSEWRQLYYDGNKFSHAIHKNLQKRNKYEIVKSELLNKEGFTSIKDTHSRFVGGYETKSLTLKGRTLTEALRQIQVPVSSLWLKEKKVILDKFKDNQIGNIVVTGNVSVKVRGETHNIPIELSARYLPDLPNELGRAIRQRLADKGATYTSPKELAAIAKGAWSKLKAMRGGMKSEKAKRENARLTQPGLDPRAPKLKSHLEKIVKGKATPEEFPLKQTDSVKVNLRFSFYRDPLAKGTSKTKGSRK